MSRPPLKIPDELRGRACSICSCATSNQRWFVRSKFRIPTQAEGFICYACSMSRKKQEGREQLIEMTKAEAKKAEKIQKVIENRDLTKAAKRLTPSPIIQRHSSRISPRIIPQGPATTEYVRLEFQPDEDLVFPEATILILLENQNCVDCQTTGSIIAREKMKIIGRNIGKDYSYYTLQCGKCKSLLLSKNLRKNLTSRTTTTGKQISLETMEGVLMSFLGGNTWTSYSFIGDVPKSTYLRYEKLVCQAVEQLIRDEFKSTCNKIKEENYNLYLASNGAWTHRGWKSRASSYILRIEKATDQSGHSVELDPVFLVINLKKELSYVTPKGASVKIEGNYSGSSRGMELHALDLALSLLKAEGILKYIKIWAMDDDASSHEKIRQFPGCEKIQLASDPGHKRSNFLRSMSKLLKGKRYATLSKRIARWYLSLIKRTEREIPGLEAECQEKRENRFLEYWKHTTTHYTTASCSSLCPCQYNEPIDQKISEQECEEVLLLLETLSLIEEQPRDADETVINDEQAERSANIEETLNKKAEKKFYFNLQDEKDLEKWNLLLPLFESAVDSVGECLWMINTIKCEGSNSRRLVYLRKDRFFITSGEARSSISALRENLGLLKLGKLLSDRIYPGTLSAASIRKLEKKEGKSKIDSQRKKSKKYKKRSRTLRRQNTETKKERESQEGYLKTNKKTLENVAKRRTHHLLSKPSEAQKIKNCKTCGKDGHSRVSSSQCPKGKNYKPPTEQSKKRSPERKDQQNEKGIENKRRRN